MRWQHEVDPDWLRARHKYLTATDIVKLWPAAKKWKRGDSMPPTFIGLWMDKHSNCDVNPVSFDAAARGHCMEPFAVLDANVLKQKNFHHWDDVVIHNGSLGFSPDAMNIPQPLLPVDVDYTDPCIEAVSEIMEVKCFAPYHHGQCVVSGPEKDQRIQIAMAFKVLPDLQRAYITYYCPGAYIDIHVSEFHRNDLAEEFGMIDRVVDIWNCLTDMLKDKESHRATYSEEQINDIVMDPDVVWGE